MQINVVNTIVSILNCFNHLNKFIEKVLTPSHDRVFDKLQTVPLPSASRFLCAENSRSSFLSSSVREWQ